MPTPNIEAQNTGVIRWKDNSFRSIKASYMRLIRSAGRSGDGLDSLKMRTKQTYGEVDQITLTFKRYLIWVHKGAGKGEGGSKGSTWYDKFGKMKKTNPESLGKIGSGTRRKEEWLNPVLDEAVPKLADIVAGFKADGAVKLIQIK
jgi:hypothetical protein